MTDVEAIPGADASPAPRKGGRGLAALALLLGAVAAGGAAFALWQLQRANPAAAVDARLTLEARRLEAAIGRAREAAEDAVASNQTLAESIASQQATLDGLTAALADARREQAPAARDWKLAEVEYLLRIANGRLLMERDAQGAVQMLAAADALLRELDDFALHEVRAALAAERLALAAADAANAQTVFLRLEAVKDALDGLPAGTPAFKAPDDGGAAKPAADAAQTDSADSAWSALQRRFLGLFDYRTRSAVPPRPLLRPEETLYLELNMRLALERAQLGALRGDDAVYRTSLETAQGWLQDHLDGEDAAVQRVAAELGDLLRIDVAGGLPDISGSLNRLREVMRGSAAAAPAPPADAAANPA